MLACCDTLVARSVFHGVFLTNNSLFLNFGWLSLPNEAEKNVTNSAYEGFRYGQ